MSAETPAVQDHYPDDFALCYGCGRLNPHGLQLKTRWDGEDTLTRYTPRPEHTALPGYVYGGLLASVIDCHGTGSAAAAWLRARGIAIGEQASPRFVTGTLTVKYLKPTPIDAELLVRGLIREVGERKVIVDAELSAGGIITCTGQIIAIRLPEAP